GGFGLVVLDSAIVASVKDTGTPVVVAHDTCAKEAVAAAGEGPGAAPDGDDDEGANAGPKGVTAADLQDRYNRIAPQIPPNGNFWLLSHVSFNAVRCVDGKAGKTTAVDNTLQQQALGGLLSPSIQMIVSGHIHMFEALSFDKDMPPQLVVGTGGTNLAKQPGNPTKIGGTTVTSSVIEQQFAYMVWKRDGQDRAKWHGTAFGQDGTAIAL